MIANLSWPAGEIRDEETCPKSALWLLLPCTGQHHGRQGYTAGVRAVGGQAQAAMLPAGCWEPILPFALFGFWALVSSLAPPHVPSSLGRHKATELTDDA